jgi:DNA repair protein RadD
METPTLSPRWYQSQANDAVWKYLSEKQGNPVVVLPTGAGKSLLIALLIRQALEFGGRVVVLAHRKELLQQNADEIRALIPGVDVGIYSAGLKSKEIHNAVVVAGIQSVFRKAADLGRRHLVLVDECHLISDLEESMYQQFFAGIQQAGLRIVGLTATPFRTGSGPICGPDRLFHRIPKGCEVKTAQLITEGFLCPITNKPADFQVNTDKVTLRGGEFIESEMQAVFGGDDTVKQACQEIWSKCDGRRSILIFASGVCHAEDIANELSALTGERVGVVTGETLDIERASMLSDFKNQRLRWLVNCDVLTTGFNARCVDAIAILRATMSPGLFCQMVGRGLRLHEGKSSCLLLDFGGNIARHGSIDDDNFGRATESKGRAAIAAENGRGKQCPACELDVAASRTSCPECGFVFPRKSEARHDSTADTDSQLTGPMPAEEWTVIDVIYKRHTKRDDELAPPTLRVDYVVSKGEGNLQRQVVPEWVCLQHVRGNFGKTMAGLWWERRSDCEEPDTIDDALSLLAMGVARKPSKITTKKDGKWTRILSCEFDSEKPTELAEVEESRTYSGLDEDVPF